MARFATGDVDEALDLVQDAMMAFVGRYRDKPPDQRRPLFYRTLNNRIIDWRRQRARHGRWLFSRHRAADATTDGPDPVAVSPRSAAADGLLERIVSALDARHGALDDAPRRRLDRARRLALSVRVWRPARRFAVPLVATAAAATLAWVAIGRSPAAELPVPPRTDDLDLLTRQEFELFVEDPEFYAWLAVQAEETPRQTRPPEKSG